MNDNSANNKRIVKNTLLLYVRMMFLMFVSLYMSRVVLEALGVEDYGIYSVVGGLVMMFTILSGSLSAAITRFITFELGKASSDKLKKVFSSSVTIQLGLALVIVVIAETIGLWFLNSKMVIPDGRMPAANWCFQFSVLTFVVNLISVPYNATIIAHEKMSAFAYISILEAVGKLIVALCIVYSPCDRLVFYAVMLAVIACSVRLLYGWYCKHHFEECTYHFIYDHDLLKQMFGFAGWNFFGAGSYQLMTQGVNLLSNLYFGVTVNAARGISTQVEHAITMFTNNFTTAINPQITKSYASNQREYMYSLIFNGAKYSFFLMLYLAVPLICETRQILEIWLKNVPEHTVSFIRLTILSCMISVLSSTMITAMLATGNIKKYQIVVGGLGMLVFPITWLFFILGYTPEMAYITAIVIIIAQLVFRLYLLRDMVGMSIRTFAETVLGRVMITSIGAFSLPVVIIYYTEDSFLRFSLVCFTSLLVTSISILVLGLKNSERRYFCDRFVAAFKRIW